MKSNAVNRVIGKGRARFLSGLLAFVLLSGCSNPFEPARPPSGNADPERDGLVHIVIGENHARTIQPGAEAVEGYRLISSASPAQPVDFTGDSVEIYLPDGTHTVTGTAYKKGGIIGNAADEIARGSISITLAGGIVTSNGGLVPTIFLGPLGTDNGILQYSIAGPSAAGGTMKLWDMTGALVGGFGVSGVLTFSVSPSIRDAQYTLPAGRYMVEIQLGNIDGDIALLREVVEIWADTTTAIEFAPTKYLDPSALPAYRGANLSATSTIGGVSIGTGTGSGEHGANPKSYTLVVGDIRDAAQDFILENDSPFAAISWAATTGSAPGAYNTTEISDFSTNYVLWVKVVSEDLSTTRYYKFTLHPPPLDNGAFTDTDMGTGEIGGNITWTCPSPANGISGYHIYWGSGPDTKLPGFDTVVYTIANPETDSQTVAEDTQPPPEATHFLVYRYNGSGNDYPFCLAIPIVDISFNDVYGAFTVTGIDGAGASGISWASPVLTVTGNGPYLIKGTGSPTTDRIQVQSGVSAAIILEDINIDVSGTSGAAAFDLSGATVNLTLTGSNILASGDSRAGIHAPWGSTLEISANSTGSLDATGGNGGAGIGGGGGVTISGGTVTATGGVSGAGIGGNSGGGGGSIMIDGGTVTARGGVSGAGIGGGSSGGGGGVTIAGGTVTATGGGTNSSGGGSITISGGAVNATGKIGGSTYMPPDEGTITGLSGNAVVFASSIGPILTAGGNATQAIVFKGNAGTMYGDVILGFDVTIPAGRTLNFLDNSQTLTVPGAVTLTNNGTINKNGGTIVGTVAGNGKVN
jgi:hypothetical protein